MFSLRCIKCEQIQSNLDHSDSGLDEIVRIIENMNINEEQKRIKQRKRHLIVKQNIYKSVWKKYGYIFTVFTIRCEYLYMWIV